MKQRAWLIYLVGGLTLSVVAGAIGSTTMIGICSQILGWIAVGFGLRSGYGKSKQIGRPWRLFAYAGACFLIAGVVRMAHSMVTGVDRPFPSPADAIALTGHVLLIVGGNLLGHLRSPDRNRAAIIDGADADAFVAAAKAALEPMGAQTMLTDGIADAYRKGRDRVAGSAGVQEVLTSVCDLRNATPYLYETTGAQWLGNAELGEEVFGPLGLIVRVSDFDEMVTVAHSIVGQLTCTLHMDDGDAEQARTLMPILQRKAGRILANGYPTGVEVCDAMVHGGPYPASTNFGATSVGTLSIRRFLRPVCYQNMPASILPADIA